nr:MAG TPA: hypothetical protein [Caudoviricetes sp.]
MQKPQDPTSYLQFLHLRVTIPPPPRILSRFSSKFVFFCNFENLSCTFPTKTGPPKWAALFLLFFCFLLFPTACRITGGVHSVVEHFDRFLQKARDRHAHQADVFDDGTKLGDDVPHHRQRPQNGRDHKRQLHSGKVPHHQRQRRIQQHGHQHRKDGAHLVGQPLPHDAGSPLPVQIGHHHAGDDVNGHAGRKEHRQPAIPTKYGAKCPYDGCKRSFCAIDIVFHPAPPLLAQINVCDAVLLPQQLRQLLDPDGAAVQRRVLGLVLGQLRDLPVLRIQPCRVVCRFDDDLSGADVQHRGRIDRGVGPSQPEILPLGHLGRVPGIIGVGVKLEMQMVIPGALLPFQGDLVSPLHRLARLDIHLPAVHIPGDQIPGTVRRPGIPIQNTNAVSQLGISPGSHHGAAARRIDGMILSGPTLYGGDIHPIVFISPVLPVLGIFIPAEHHLTLKRHDQFLHGSSFTIRCGRVHTPAHGWRPCVPLHDSHAGPRWRWQCHLHREGSNLPAGRCHRL